MTKNVFLILLFFPLISFSLNSGKLPVALNPGQLDTLHTFKSIPHDGGIPRGSLTLVNDVLYGRTSFGGDNNDGAIFKIGIDGSNYQILHSFSGAPDDGRNPRHSSMTLLGNTLFGTTEKGGSINKGTIFKINLDGSEYKVIHSFDVNKGATPHSCFTTEGNTLYGTTANGGQFRNGTLYQFNSDGSNFKVIHNFDGPHGAKPHGQPLSINGYLYGLTLKGGMHKSGVIYRIKADGSDYKILHNFQGYPTDGSRPFHGALINNGNTMYGMTTEGGNYKNGVIFKISTDGSGYAILHHFSNDQLNSAYPYGSLTLYNKTLYGLTDSGGKYNKGTFFQIKPDGTGFKLLYSFDCRSPIGCQPVDSITAGKGALYGMTSRGSQYNSGAVFSHRIS